MGVAGLVLAAGEGTRFGASSKQLADFHGRPLLEWAVRAQCEVADLSRVLVVLGCCAAEVRERVAFGRAETVVCSEWERGQAWSLRCGVTDLSAGGGTGVSKVIVTLGDAPLVTPEVIRMFVAQPPRARAVYGGRPGHPVVLGPEEIAALAALDGDQGAKGLLRGGTEVEVGHLCSGRDVDTPEDLEEVRDEARAVI